MRKYVLLLAATPVLLSACNPVVCEPGGPQSGPDSSYFCINEADADLILFAGLAVLILAASSRDGGGGYQIPHID